jgi:DNA polymerase III delta prime subunit
MYWIDKFSPVSLDSVIGHTNTVNQFKSMIKTNNIPNILLYSGCGTGKSSCIKAFIHDYTVNIKNPNILYIRTITEKNIKNIKQNIIDYIKKKISHKKIIIIEDIDTLPESIQYPIATFMENNNVIFILSCNRINNLISSLQSNCLLISLPNLSNSDIVNQLTKICKIQSVKFTKTALKLIVDYSDNDLRKAINTLQLIYNTYNKVYTKNVNEIMHNTLQYSVKEYLKLCYNKDINNAISLVKKLLDTGIDTSDFFSIATSESQTFNFCENKDTNQLYQIIFIELIGNFYSKLVYGVLTNIQIYTLTFELCNNHKIEDLICKQ